MNKITMNQDQAENVDDSDSWYAGKYIRVLTDCQFTLNNIAFF